MLERETDYLPVYLSLISGFFMNMEIPTATKKVAGNICSGIGHSRNDTVV